MTKLEEIYFNDFIKLKRGYDLPNDQIVDGKYPVVASTSIKAFHKEYKVLPPSVVTGRSGSLGEVQFIDTPCWPLNTALYVKNFNKNNPKYVYYFLKMIHLENFNSGAGVPTLNQNHLHKLKIKIHSKEEQQQIAAILSAYDDLIETNNQRIATLEQLAQQIYKEWFVRLRFPGWENTHLHHGTPEEWQIKNLGEILKLEYGKSLIQENRVDGAIPVYGSSGIVGFHNKSLVNSPGIIVGRKGNVGAIHFVNRPFYPIDTVFYVVPKVHNWYFLFYMLNNQNFINSDAAVPGLNRNQAYSTKLFLPPQDLINQFENLITPLFDQIKILQEQIDILTKTRNLLLPRLISGKLTHKQASTPL